MAQAEYLSAKEKLPIFNYRKDILIAVSRNKTVIIVGDTACGKTTQIPQFLLEDGLARNKCIAITQPRRVAATSVAKWVAEEVRTELGGKVGYSIKFEDVSSTATKIKYLTDGALLREAVLNPTLSDYSIVILDDAHERTLNNDVLFGVTKRAQKYREQNNLLPLKIIVTSATLDYERFSKHFDDAPSYFICGHEYNVKLLNSNKEQGDYTYAALVTIFQIHQNEEEGDILVFYATQEEVEKAVNDIRKIAANLPAGSLQIVPCPLNSSSSLYQQSDLFKLTPQGCRKVILSTDIAETSITIPGIKYVIDTGMMKIKSYNHICRRDILSIQRISKAQADQRAGRAGREVDGSCYRLYTVKEFESFKQFSVPEILRCCLSNAILQMVATGVKNIQQFEFLDKPSDQCIHSAIRQLKFLDAVIENDGNLELTECGREMVIFPLDPRYSKMIITSRNYKCTEEILTIISLLSVESIFYTALNQRDRFYEARKKFETSDGDHIMMLNIYKAFKNAKGSPSWCHENFINAKNMKKASQIRKQLCQLCEKVGIPLTSFHNDTSNIRKCLASGLFMNTALHLKNKIFRMVDSNQKVKMHPASCLVKHDPSCCIYTELVQVSKIYMRNISYVSEEELIEVAPEYCKEKKITSFQLMSFSTEEL